jgi:hypothetical protein
VSVSNRSVRTGCWNIQEEGPEQNLDPFTLGIPTLYKERKGWALAALPDRKRKTRKAGAPADSLQAISPQFEYLEKGNDRLAKVTPCEFYELVVSLDAADAVHNVFFQQN